MQAIIPTITEDKMKIFSCLITQYATEVAKYLFVTRS